MFVDGSLPNILCLMLATSSPRMLSLLQQYSIGLTHADPAMASTLRPRSRRRNRSTGTAVLSNSTTSDRTFHGNQNATKLAIISASRRDVRPWRAPDTGDFRPDTVSYNSRYYYNYYDNDYHPPVVVVVVVAADYCDND